MTNRRLFGTQILGAAIAAAVAPECFAQVKPFVIRVVRSSDWEQLMQRELCIPGTVYSVDSDRIQSDFPGSKICYSMELPQRANQNHISAIPNGHYSAKPRLSAANGPVIELSGVPQRAAIQMHSGNAIDHTSGCILLGSTPVSQSRPRDSEAITGGECWITGSKEARKKLLALYGWVELETQPPSRPVIVLIE